MSDEPKPRRRAPRTRRAPAANDGALETAQPTTGESSEAATAAPQNAEPAAAAPYDTEPPATAAPQGAQPPAGPGPADDDEAGEDGPEIRATEPGAWAALHARRTRGRRPSRRGRSAAAATDAAPGGAGAASQAAGASAAAAPTAAAASSPVAPPAGVATSALDEVRDVIVASAAPDEALLERSPTPVSDEAMAAAAADRDVAPTRRRRRGRRGRGGAAAAEARPDEGGDPPVQVEASADVAPAAPAGAGVAPDAAEPPAAAAAALPPQQAAATSQQSAETGQGPVTTVRQTAAAAAEETAEAAARETDEAAGDEEGDEARKRRRRGHRGGRRHRRRNGDGETPAETADAAEAESGAAETAAVPAATEPGPAADVAKEERPAAAELPAGDETEAGEEPAEAGASRRRRRRRRGGGNGQGDEPAAEPATAVAEGREQTREAEPTEGVGRRRGGRLRRPKDTGVTPDLPGHKEILVSEDAGEMRVALVEDGRLAEIYIERPGKRSYAGNIYRGKVDNVLPGMDAAFVDIGLERNGFLYVDDVADPEDGEKRPRKITQMLKPGQEVLVQVSKDPMGSKGARLTGQLSLAGRYLVYVPGGSGVGVSRRLPTDERDRLRDLCKSLKAKDAGLIVRTVAEGKSVEEMKGDLRFLSRLWTRLKAKAEKVKAPGLVYAEADVSLQVARDLYDESFAAVLVDGEKRRKELVSYLDKVAPELATRVKLYDGDEALFKAHGIEEQIARALERRVPLPSGGNLVIDHTEALTVIDVNTGRFTGGKGLEDTITRNNLEAAREVVRQLRLRDIGGIIIIDFIDMEYARNREAVLAKLQAELATDRTKTYVVEISPLGLVEMTRQNITDGARGILTQTCPVCEGKARVLSAETMAITIERRLGEHAADTQARALLIEVNTAVAERLTVGGRVKRLERGTGKRIFLEGSRYLPIETYRIVAEGSLEAVESHRIPVREDEEVTVELEYALTYSPGDAVAHVGGYQVIVLNGRRALGEKRKVRITSLTRAGAMGVIVS